MADYGLKVSLPGKDVSSTVPEDFVFDSSNPANIQIVSRLGTSVVVNASSSSDVSINHGLGYIPAVMLFTELTPGSGNWHMGIPLPSTGDVYINNDPATTYVDSTYAKFRIGNNTASQKTVSYYFYIFGDSAN